MSRLLSRLGIGAATVDTRLPETAFTPGETVEATVEIEGGRSEQTIDAIYFALLSRDDGTRVIGEFQVTEPFTLGPNESRTVETELTVPPWTPITRGDRRVWLKTDLDVAWSVDPDDEDGIEVVPGPYLEAVLAAVDELGFEFRDSTLREPAWLEDRPFAQAIRFEPRKAAYRDDLDGLTIVSVPRETELRTVIEIDEQEEAEGTADVRYDSQEVFHTFDTTDPAMVRRQLESTIDQHTHTD